MDYTKITQRMDLLRELVSCLSEVVDRYLDEIELSILKVYAYYGSISLYKASNLTGFAVSTTYKKAKKLIELGLLKSETTHSHRITVKGLLQCIVQDLEDAPYMINKIKLIWRLNAKFDEICAYLILLARALKMQNLKLSSVPSLDDFRDTAKYLFPPIMQSIVRSDNTAQLHTLIANVLNVRPEIAKLCEGLVVRAFTEFFAIFTLKMLSIIAGAKTRAVLLLYDGFTQIDVFDLCSLDPKLVELRIRSFREKMCPAVDSRKDSRHY